MASINSLPVELIKAITLKLPQSDLCNLRLANKRLAAGSFDVFKLQFEEKAVMLVRPSLESLLALSKTDCLASCVRTLTISSYRFSIRRLRGGVNLHTVLPTESRDPTEVVRSSNKEAPSVEVGSSINIRSFATHRGRTRALKHAGLTHCQFAAYREYLQDQFKLYEAYEHIQMLSQCLQNFKKLHSIHLLDSVKLTSHCGHASGILGIDSIADAIGIRNLVLLKIVSHGRWILDTQLAFVLNAIADSKGNSLQCLSVQPDINNNAVVAEVRDETPLMNPEGLQDQRASLTAMLDNLSKTGTRFPNIKSLHLGVPGRSLVGIFMHRVTTYRRSNLDGDVEQLIRLFPNLSAMNLTSFVKGHIWLPAFSKGFQMHHLTKLEVGMFTAALKGIISLLLSFCMLEDIAFKEVVLSEGYWSDLVPTVVRLKALKRMEFKDVKCLANGVFGNGAHVIPGNVVHAAPMVPFAASAYVTVVGTVPAPASTSSHGFPPTAPAGDSASNATAPQSNTLSSSALPSSSANANTASAHAPPTVYTPSSAAPADPAPHTGMNTDSDLDTESEPESAGASNNAVLYAPNLAKQVSLLSF